MNQRLTHMDVFMVFVYLKFIRSWGLFNSSETGIQMTENWFSGWQG